MSFEAVPDWDENNPADWEALAGHLDDIDAMLSKYVSFPSDECRWAVALWVMHTHLVNAFESTPRLALLSPEPGSGKTRTLEVLDVLCWDPMHVSNTSLSALFRSIAKRQPTILYDEADATFGDKANTDTTGDIRALINAGHRTGATVTRGVGPLHEPTEFPVFAAVAIAGLGDLPPTIMHRSVIIRMRRRAPGEVVSPFRIREGKRVGHAIRDRLAAWAEAHRHTIEDSALDVVMPSGVEDRDADVWEALVVIGKAADGVWSVRASSAAIALTGNSEDAQSLGLKLLEDIRTVTHGMTEIKTADLLDRLNDLDESPWADYRGKALGARSLGMFLRKYQIRPHQRRFEDGENCRGFPISDFSDAWNRYLPADPETSVTSVTPDTSSEPVTETSALTSAVTDVTVVTGSERLGDRRDSGSVTDDSEGFSLASFDCSLCGDPATVFVIDDDGQPLHPNCGGALATFDNQNGSVET